MLNYQYIKARDLGDAWFQTLFKMLEEGTVFKIDRGSYAGQKRLEFDFIVVQIEHPGTRPLLPQIEAHHNIPNPVADDYLDDYLPNYLMGHELEATESYTYGQRLTHYPTKHWYADQYPINKIVIEEFGLLESLGIIQEDKFWGKCVNQIDLLFGFIETEDTETIKWFYKLVNQMICYFKTHLVSDILIQGFKMENYIFIRISVVGIYGAVSMPILAASNY